MPQTLYAVLWTLLVDSGLGLGARVQHSIRCAMCDAICDQTHKHRTGTQKIWHGISIPTPVFRRLANMTWLSLCFRSSFLPYASIQMKISFIFSTKWYVFAFVISDVASRVAGYFFFLSSLLYLSSGSKSVVTGVGQNYSSIYNVSYMPQDLTYRYQSTICRNKYANLSISSIRIINNRFHNNKINLHTIGLLNFSVAIDFYHQLINSDNSPQSPNSSFIYIILQF